MKFVPWNSEFPSQCKSYWCKMAVGGTVKCHFCLCSLNSECVKIEEPNLKFGFLDGIAHL